MAVLKKNQLLFGIVCFRERFWECSSFIRLHQSYLESQSSEPLHIFVFDNTDSKDWFIDYPSFEDNIKITYQRNPSNPGISFAYNRIGDFAKNNDFEYIVFFDQDSELTKNTYSVYENFSKKNILAAAPKVISQNQLISPSKYINYRSYLYDDLSSKKILLNGNSCINSGLMVKTSIFFETGAYNENLRLDFCDHDFIERLGTTAKELHILPYELHQNFSTDTNTLEQALFRFRLFDKDLSAFKKNRNKLLITLLVDFPHLLRLTMQYKTLAFLKIKFSGK